MTGWSLPGCRFRPLHFEPTFHKFAGQVCGGVQVHVTDPEIFESVTTYTAAIAAIAQPVARRLRLEAAALRVRNREAAHRHPGRRDPGGAELEAGLSPWQMKAAWDGTAAGLRRSHRRVPAL